MYSKFKFLLIFFCLSTSSLQAQIIGVVVDPNPSPYLSDWQERTETAILIINNTGIKEIKVKVRTELFDGKRVLVANTDDSKMPILSLPPMSTTRYDAEDIFSSHAVKLKGKLEISTLRTGRIPDDNYQICVTLIDPQTGAPVGSSGTVCKVFNILAYQAPTLINPTNKEIIKGAAIKGIVFRWSPVIPSPKTIVTYRLQIWEVLEMQNSMTALRSNMPIVEKDFKGVLQTQWPIDFPLPDTGRTYVWTITPLDDQERKMVDGLGFAEPFEFRACCFPPPLPWPDEDEITLVSPGNGEEISKDVTFIWKDVAAAPKEGYTLKIVEIKGEQSPEDAIVKNPPVFEQKGIMGTSFKFSDNTLKFEKGKKYAWAVKGNGGFAEPFEFKACCVNDWPDVGKKLSLATEIKNSSEVLFTWTTNCCTGSNRTCCDPEPRKLSFIKAVVELEDGQTITDALNNNKAFKAEEKWSGTGSVSELDNIDDIRKQIGNPGATHFAWQVMVIENGKMISKSDGQSFDFTASKREEEGATMKELTFTDAYKLNLSADINNENVVHFQWSVNCCSGTDRTCCDPNEPEPRNLSFLKRVVEIKERQTITDALKNNPAFEANEKWSQSGRVSELDNIEDIRKKIGNPGAMYIAWEVIMVDNGKVISKSEPQGFKMNPEGKFETLSGWSSDDSRATPVPGLNIACCGAHDPQHCYGPGGRFSFVYTQEEKFYISVNYAQIIDALGRYDKSAAANIDDYEIILMLDGTNAVLTVDGNKMGQKIIINRQTGVIGLIVPGDGITVSGRLIYEKNPKSAMASCCGSWSASTATYTGGSSGTAGFSGSVTLVQSTSYSFSLPGTAYTCTGTCTPTYKWFVDGNTYSGTSMSTSFLTTGNHVVIITASCGTDTCSSRYFTVNIPGPTCACGSWSTTPGTYSDSTGGSTGSLPSCGSSTSLNLSLGTAYIFYTPIYTCPIGCTTTYKWSINGGPALATGPNFYHTFTLAGSYTLTITPYCGTTACSPCTINVTVTGSSCTCGNWSTVYPQNRLTFIGSATKWPCGSTISFPFSNSTPYTFTSPLYICNPSGCLPTYKWYVNGSYIGTSTTRTYSLTFTQPGTNTIKIVPYCGTTPCTPCTYTINVGSCNICAGWATTSMTYRDSSGGVTSSFSFPYSGVPAIHIPLGVAYTFTSAIYKCNPFGCAPKYIWLVNGVQQGPATTSPSKTLTFPVNGNYIIKIIGICGATQCMPGRTFYLSVP